MFFHVLGNEHKLAQSVQSDYRRTADSFRRVKALRAQFKKDVMENVNFQTRIDLFSNYSEEPTHIDVNWEVLIAMKVNKYISATVTTNLIYDHDVDIAVDEDGDDIIDAIGPRTQFKEVLGVGLSVKF